MWKKIEKWILKHEWMFLILVAVVVLRIPTLFEPYWYGDEGIYLTIGQSVRKGAAIYKDIHDNKPPLLYWIAAVADGNQFWYRGITAMWNLATVMVMARLAEKVFKENPKIKELVVWIFALLTNLPLLEGNIANAELFFLLPTLAAATLLFDSHVTTKRIAWAGVLIGMGGLFKIPAVVEMAVWPLLWWATGERKWFARSIVLGVGVAVPLGLSLVYFASQGVLPAYLAAAGAQNVPYLSSWKAGVATGIYTLKGRIVVLAIFLAVLWGLSRRIGRLGTWLGMWGGMLLFAALLSGRPYPHYLLQMAGVLAIAGGVIVTGKRPEKLVMVVILGMVVGAYRLFGFYSYRVPGYYLNFGKWMFGQQSQQSYYAWFNPTVNDNYEIARIVMQGSRPEEKLFVWGDEPMIYALAKRSPAGRFTVAYHIKDFKAQQETVTGLISSPPKYVVSFGREGELPGLKDLLEWRYHLEKTVGEAKIYRLTGLSWWRY